MKGVTVTETVERKCCEPQDLRVYKGADILCFNDEKIPIHPVIFCQHCGQLYVGEHRNACSPDILMTIERPLNNLSNQFFPYQPLPLENLPK